LSYLSQLKGERDKKGLKLAQDEPRLPEPADNSMLLEKASILGAGMIITGNIVCDGSVQIFGRVIGDIHVSHLLICEGAEVEGKITAEETSIQGAFKGTLHSNTVKLQGNAAIEGEIFNKSLTIEPNVQFEGTARRLNKPVDPPSNMQTEGEILPTTLLAGATPVIRVVG
jgi:cytoskeletal protein CcmA (bactofilin family)